MKDDGTEDDEAPIEERLPGYHYGVALALVFGTYVFMASGFTGGWTRVVTVALQGATLLVVLAASKVGRRLLRAATVIVLVALVASLALSASDSTALRASFLILDFLLVATAPVVIAVSIIRRHVVDIRTILGALCIYVLLGMAFAFLYGAISELISGPFFEQTTDATTAEFLYFSFVTLTTVGYGDFTAADGIGRATASLEGLFGQLYLVTIVALLVSRVAAAPRGQEASTDEQA